MIEAIRAFSGASFTAICLMGASFILGGAFVILALVFMEQVRKKRNPDNFKE